MPRRSWTSRYVASVALVGAVLHCQVLLQLSGCISSADHVHDVELALPMELLIKHRGTASTGMTVETVCSRFSFLASRCHKNRKTVCFQQHPWFLALT